MTSLKVGDRISGLSDPLLQQILSYLSLTDVGRLSTLSKRWRKVWMLLPSLDFTRFYPSSLSREEATVKAMNMISRVLIHNRTRPLKALTLYLPYYVRYYDAFVGWCITIALTRRVERLAILLNDCDSVWALPSDLVSRFSSLTHLHLSGCTLPLPESTCSFSLLRSLHISLVDLVGTELERLTSSDCCPVLEILTLSKCNECRPLTLSLSNPSIRHLHISIQSCQREILEIAAPHVTHLKLVGEWRRYMVIDLSAVVEVTLNFDVVRFPWDKNEKAESLATLNSFFVCVPSSAKLHLSPWFLQVLQVADSQELVASSIKAKDVTITTGPDFSDIPDLVFFFNSHDIEHLTINMSSKMRLNKILCHNRCGCLKVGLHTQGIEDAGKKYCMLFAESLSMNNNLKTVVLDGFFEECGNNKAEDYCAHVRRSWQFELARIILVKLQNLEKMLLKGRSIQLGISSLLAELCCSLPKALSTTIIECFDTKGSSSGKKVVNQLCPMALHSCDRLSILPNELLLNILSYLQLREAIRTGILSKRWKRLWTFLSSLDFTNDTFDFYLWKRSEIINQVLAQHEASTLSSFCLYSRRRADAQHDSWIAFAISRHARRLVLHLNRYELPPYLFHYSKYLTFLELSLCIITLPQLPFSFASLKVLHIGETNFEEPTLLERLTSSVCCPVLEKLQLSYCNPFKSFTVFLTNPSLRNLSLRQMVSDSLDICAPHVSHLMLLGKWDEIRDVTLKSMSSLTESTFDLDQSTGDVIICFTIDRFLVSFSRGIKLHFSGFVNEVLSQRGIKNSNLLRGSVLGLRQCSTYKSLYC